MSYVLTPPGYYQQFQIGTALEEGTEGWTRAPFPGWGQNAALVGPKQIAVGSSPDGLGAYYATRTNQAIGQSEGPGPWPLVLGLAAMAGVVLVAAKMVGDKPKYRANSSDRIAFDAEAEKLAASLNAYVQGRHLRAKYDPRERRIYFTGGGSGSTQGLDISVSSKARVLAHWDGYVYANTRIPKVGDRVRFPSGSSPHGTRMGKVVKVGPKRVVVEYTYKHGGKAAPKSVRIDDLTF